MDCESHTMRYRRKRFILQLTAGGFIFILLLNFDWWAVFYEDHGEDEDWNDETFRRQNPTEKRTNNVVREMMGKLYLMAADSSDCTIPNFKNIPPPSSRKESTCHRKKPSAGSCQLARQLFGDPENKDLQHVCDHQTKQEFCKIHTTKRGHYQVICDISTCQEGVHFGIVDIHTAEEIWADISNVEVLEESILSALHEDNVGFCLIRCGWDDELGNLKFVPAVDSIDHSVPLSQILILPPYLKSPDQSINRDFINFNFVFVDSVSRSHFFRSLPKSVKVLENIAMERKSHSYSPVVLDYQLVQAVRSRTFESLQTLFSGDINPFEKPFGVQAMPRSRLKIDGLLKPLKTLGYNTQWIEDLCPIWEWGIAKDFLVYNKTLSAAELWQKLQQTVRQMNIDSIGPTLSSCRILHASGYPDQFHGPDKICYNGKQQHDYILEYLYFYHTAMHKQNLPYFSFYESNIAHEATGLRVQYFDEVFSQYLKYTATLDNTLTVLFSDHGNSYGDFVSSSSEGRTEMYNPYLFLIIPPGVQKFLGKQNMNILTNNQDKLISFLDVHYTLKYVIEKVYKSVMKSHSNSDNYQSKVSKFNQQFNVSRYGLFAPISESRSCSDIPRIMPNLCICAGYDSVSRNVDLDLILALYVLGQINNQIQTQRRKHQRHINGTVEGGFGGCYRLMAEKMENIQKSKDGDKVTLKMDLHVTSPRQRFPEIFFIAVTMETVEESLISFNLENFDRITQYSIYSLCADPGVDLSLCVCDLEKVNSLNSGQYNKNVTNDIFSDKVKISYEMIEVNGVKCLKVIQRSGLHGVVAEGQNGCNLTLTLYVAITPDNLVLSSIEEVVLYPGDMTFLVAGVAMDTQKAWNWDIQIDVFTQSD